MFFLLSKTVGIMLLPTNFLIGIGLAGMALLATRFASAGRRLLIVSVALLAICGFSPLGYMLLYPLEQRFPAWDASRGAPDGIVVLGGSIYADVSTAHGVVVVGGAADRIIASAALAHRYPNSRILFTGGSGHLISNDAREADYAASLFESLGISRERLIMERRSRNTQENAEFSRAIAAPKDGERWLLVTSAFHMPRSIGLFRKAGFAVEAYPVDWRVGGRGDVVRFSALSLDGLDRVNVGVREWLGLAAYWLTGKIDALLPGPGGPVATSKQSG
ncbi:YdcF family protein [Bradyrhizobium sediminis]|uniref:YdcF family protein n=1 Tax=Bradyrhizobium sediminis TaxID=2840469 RepID=A0A975NJL3_9BRAD|nr:YdcF family protein [Bradyrhizobium sediminis]QWG16397.1 YdcF family protein [Bradyrhizobium sediminis]